MLRLRYVAGAIPGKSLKRKNTESDDKREKSKKYEENRKAHKFNGSILIPSLSPTLTQYLDS
jgi:hypothetical protein